MHYKRYGYFGIGLSIMVFLSRQNGCLRTELIKSFKN
jgi:hypothetical protein